MMKATKFPIIIEENKYLVAKSNEPLPAQAAKKDVIKRMIM
jgi:hypothetical protein